MIICFVTRGLKMLRLVPWLLGAMTPWGAAWRSTPLSLFTLREIIHNEPRELCFYPVKDSQQGVLMCFHVTASPQSSHFNQTATCSSQLVVNRTGWIIRLTRSITLTVSTEGSRAEFKSNCNSWRSFCPQTLTTSDLQDGKKNCRGPPGKCQRIFPLCPRPCERSP